MNLIKSIDDIMEMDDLSFRRKKSLRKDLKLVK